MCYPPPAPPRAHSLSHPAARCPAPPLAARARAAYSARPHPALGVSQGPNTLLGMPPMRAPPVPVAPTQCALPRPRRALRTSVRRAAPTPGPESFLRDAPQAPRTLTPPVAVVCRPIARRPAPTTDCVPVRAAAGPLMGSVDSLGFTPGARACTRHRSCCADPVRAGPPLHGAPSCGAHPPATRCCCADPGHSGPPPPALYHSRFIVDGQTVVTPTHKIPNAVDDQGFIVNYVAVPCSAAASPTFLSASAGASAQTSAMELLGRGPRGRPSIRWEGGGGMGTGTGRGRPITRGTARRRPSPRRRSPHRSRPTQAPRPPTQPRPAVQSGACAALAPTPIAVLGDFLARSGVAVPSAVRPPAAAVALRRARLAHALTVRTAPTHSPYAPHPLLSPRLLSAPCRVRSALPLSPVLAPPVGHEYAQYAHAHAHVQHRASAMRTHTATRCHSGSCHRRMCTGATGRLESTTSSSTAAQAHARA
ncbi:hypothetical protein B0H14DRAFT_3456125 [Mycena olivaceomarginata]|nr:hypothetical protein B0H14DRAFT_3456125 [Mycena olivaceomarginata]